MEVLLQVSQLCKHCTDLVGHFSKWSTWGYLLPSFFLFIYFLLLFLYIVLSLPSISFFLYNDDTINYVCMCVIIEIPIAFCFRFGYRVTRFNVVIKYFRYFTVYLIKLKNSCILLPKIYGYSEKYCLSFIFLVIK